jgi:hypothetical protein
MRKGIPSISKLIRLKFVIAGNPVSASELRPRIIENHRADWT